MEVENSENAKMPEKRIFAKAGHICMICGFRARTKNKYRELQDHLVRQHFQVSMLQNTFFFVSESKGQ
jgi:hypothetical protein